MRPTAGWFASLLLVSILPSPLARAGDDIREQLKADYLGKVLTLRHFYEGTHLTFQTDGSLLGMAEVGPWTVDGQVFVETIELHESTLQIHARRVCLVFDSKDKPYRDVLDLLAESKAPDRDKLQGSFWGNEVDIEILLASVPPGPQEITSAMNAVFLAPGDSLRDIVPEFWQDYFDKIEGRPQMVRHSTETVYTVISGPVSPPQVLHQADPEFSVEARKAKYHGVMTVSLVVDSSGTPRDVEIMSPLGLGLDEKAVAAVRSWKFKPAMRNGKPVPVRIAVEVDFHLY